jgi:hypothetical protein
MARTVDQIYAPVRLSIVRSKELLVNRLAFLVCLVEAPHHLLLNQICYLFHIFLRWLVKLSFEFILTTFMKVYGLGGYSGLAILAVLNDGLPLDPVRIVFEISRNIVTDSESKFKIFQS